MEYFNKNFQIGFAPFCAMVLLSAFTFEAVAEDIEEIVVVAQQVKTTEADALTSTTIVESILPSFTWTAGGTGAFQGYNERGAQTVHTAVYKNGIPANTPGSAWYDFGHEIVSGQSVKVISGANSVMYGSGSIAGTVLIEDTIERSITSKLGSNQEKYISVAPTSWFQYTDYTTEQQAETTTQKATHTKTKVLKLLLMLGTLH